MSSGISVSQGNFEAEVLQASVPVLVDFWAPWCGPCRMIGPVLDQVAAEYTGRLKLVKINVDEEGELAQSHGIVSIPTLVLYKNGAIQQRQVGALPAQDIKRLVEEFL